MWISINIPTEGEDELQRSLDFLTEINRGQIARHKLPHPYKAGIRYKREPPRRERWQTAIETLRRKEGDCEDLATYLAAWLQLQGHDARAMLRRSSLGWHVVVMANGETIDPSRALGMGKKDAA